MDSQDKLNTLTRTKITGEGDTKMTQTQPLDTIHTIMNVSDESLMDASLRNFKETVDKSIASMKKKFDGVNDILNNISEDESEENEFESGCEIICSQCQIKDIIGNFRGCGLYQYGEQFEVQTRRRL